VFKSRQRDSVLAEAWMDAGRLFHTHMSHYTLCFSIHFSQLTKPVHQCYFLMWPKQQTASSRTTKGRNS